MRTLARRVAYLDDEVDNLATVVRPLVERSGPGLLAMHGVGYDVAAKLLVAAGDNPDRLRSEAAFAHLCGVAPLEASSGKTRRHRLNRGGDRQANNALYRVVITRMAVRTRPPRPTSPAVVSRASRPVRSCASSSATSPVKPSNTSARTRRSIASEADQPSTGRRTGLLRSPDSREPPPPGITGAADPVSTKHRRHRRRCDLNPAAPGPTVAGLDPSNRPTLPASRSTNELSTAAIATSVGRDLPGACPHPSG